MPADAGTRSAAAEPPAAAAVVDPTVMSAVPSAAPGVVFAVSGGGTLSADVCVVGGGSVPLAPADFRGSSVQQQQGDRYCQQQQQQQHMKHPTPLMEWKMLHHQRLPARPMYNRTADHM